jgi:hypothetical protein
VGTADIDLPTERPESRQDIGEVPPRSTSLLLQIEKCFT